MSRLQEKRAMRKGTKNGFTGTWNSTGQGKPPQFHCLSKNGFPPILPSQTTQKAKGNSGKKKAGVGKLHPGPLLPFQTPPLRQQLLPRNGSRPPASFLRLSRPALHLESPEPLHLSCSLDPVLAAHLHLRILIAHPEMRRTLLSGGPGCPKARV